MHRTETDVHFRNIFEILKKTSNYLVIKIKVPWLSDHQTNRSNHNVKTPKEYYRVSICLPYLEFLINSLDFRFSQTYEIPFEIGKLHPSEVIKSSKCDFIHILEEVHDLYKIDNFIEEGRTRYD